MPPSESDLIIINILCEKYKLCSTHSISFLRPQYEFCFEVLASRKYVCKLVFYYYLVGQSSDLLCGNVKMVIFSFKFVEKYDCQTMKGRHDARAIAREKAGWGS
jgi:hypothetical protein